MIKGTLPLLAVLATPLLLRACAEETTGGLRPASQQPPEIVEADFASAEVATVGLDALSSSPIVLLREIEGGRLLPIWVGFAEARAIAVSLHGIDFPRPMTHDLMRNLLGELHAELVAVLVNEVRDGTYYGLLELRRAGGEKLLLDTRPSDGIALAVRTGAEIRIARQLLDESPDFQFIAPDEEEQVVNALGLTVVWPSDEQRQALELPSRDGLLVTAARGRAAELGVAADDFIVAIDGLPPTSPMSLLEAERDAAAGAVIELTYWRAGEERTAAIPVPGGRSRPRSRGALASAVVTVGGRAEGRAA